MHVREYETREPTGKPPWPITLIAGGEKAGKSWAAAQASGSELVGRTFWISTGEDDPDEYKHVPGARFEIVKHDGTYRDILGATIWSSRQPRDDQDRPNLIVFDSGSRLWSLLSDMGQHEANERARKKAEKYKKKFDPDEEIVIGRDLWNIATSRWGNVLDALREHDGPSIITARLHEVSGTDAQGQPTAERIWKVAAQKDLAYDVGAIVEIPRRGEAYVTGVRSVKFDVPIGQRKTFDGFTMDALWRRLGLDAPDATAPRQHTTLKPDEQLALLNAANDLRDEAVRTAWDDPDALLAIYNRAMQSGAGTVTVQGVADVLEGAAAPLTEIIKARGLFLRNNRQRAEGDDPAVGAAQAEGYEDPTTIPAAQDAATAQSEAGQ